MGSYGKLLEKLLIRASTCKGEHGYCDSRLTKGVYGRGLEYQCPLLCQHLCSHRCQCVTSKCESLSFSLTREGHVYPCSVTTCTPVSLLSLIFFKTKILVLINKNKCWFLKLPIWKAEYLLQ